MGGLQADNAPFNAPLARSACAHFGAEELFGASPLPKSPPKSSNSPDYPRDVVIYFIFCFKCVHASSS